jgi:hypothetical protein
MMKNEPKREPQRSAAGTPLQAIMLIGFILFVILANLLGFNPPSSPEQRAQYMNYVLSNTGGTGGDDFDYARQP